MCCVVYPLPWPLLVGGVRCSRLWSTSQLLRPSGQLFSFYIADMPTPTYLVKRVCYTDDLTVWDSGVNIPDLEVGLNNYLEEITAYLKDTSLLTSGLESSVTLLTPDTHQAKTHPSIFIEDSRLPMVKYPRILGVWTPPYHSISTTSKWQR